ncbi:MAG: hypothetical protein ACRD2G_00550, partial [Terriglobia bacterium]
MSKVPNVNLDFVLASCRYYPVKIDLCRRLIWFAEIDREMYQRAGFLVPKQAKMSEERYGFNLDDVLLYDLSLPIGGAPSHYVFITAFCCSTLLARLLDRVPGCLVLKEPGILGQLGMLRYRPAVPVIPAQAGIHCSDVDPRLRGGDTGRARCSGDFTSPAVATARSMCRGFFRQDKGPRHESRAVATTTPKDAGGTPALQDWEEEWQTWSRLGMRLLTRTFDPGQTVIVKPSDVGNSMCDVMLENDPRSKAVLLSVDLRTFILSVLKMEDRRKLVRKRANLWYAALRGHEQIDAGYHADPAEREKHPGISEGAVARTCVSQVRGFSPSLRQKPQTSKAEVCAT